MKTATALLRFCLLSVGAAPCLAQTVSTPAAVEAAAPPAAAETVSVSQVRIVRLSQVKGDVELDRKTGQSFDQAFANLPIVAGAALRTKQGLAEVEFEDNSSLRLTPESQVEFPRLGRANSGATVTAVNLLRGSLYVSLAGGKAEGDFTVNAGNQAIVLSPSTHLRLDLDAPTARMVVFQGSATVTGPSGSVVVTKKKAVGFDTASTAPPEFIHLAEAGAYDAWDKNAADYHKVPVATFAGASGFAGSPYAYGFNDLNNYGSFSNVGGCGNMWRPYLASASFDPYGSGVWSWYPGQGYSWVSLYPWGWTPFHSGSWNYCPAGGGWGWSPQGGNWRGVLNQPVATLRGPATHTPVRPPAPPLRGEPTLIAVNVRALHFSQPAEGGKFLFRADSAGLGVPRAVFDSSHLARISQDVAAHGFAQSSLSERQAEAGLLASGRSSGAMSSPSSTSAVRSSAMRSAGASASGSNSASRSAPVTAPSSGSFSSAASGAGAAHSSGGSSGSSAHH